MLHSVERQEHIGLERPDEVAPDALAAVGHRTALPSREAGGDGAGQRHTVKCRVARSLASLSRDKLGEALKPESLVHPVSPDMVGDVAY